jgi:polyhydroxyalkanoate synthesis regulator phasin
MKYKITISEGCTAFCTEINGKVVGGEDPRYSFTEEKIDELIDYLCERFKEERKQGTVLLDDLIKCFQPDSWHYDEEFCDQCGDTVSSQTWEV